MPRPKRKDRDALEALSILVKSHPWHGVPIGAEAPGVVTTFVEIVPTDTVKYELDKATGLLKIDRPQQYSNVCPTPYGFIPQTLCAEQVGALLRASARAGAGIVGDGDPMDICVLTEKDITHGEHPRAGHPHRRPADARRQRGRRQDRRRAAGRRRASGAGATSRTARPPLLDRLRHYFLTYKQSPDRIAGRRARSPTSTAARKPSR